MPLPPSRDGLRVDHSVGDHHRRVRITVDESGSLTGLVSVQIAAPERFSAPALASGLHLARTRYADAQRLLGSIIASGAILP